MKNAIIAGMPKRQGGQEAPDTTDREPLLTLRLRVDWPKPRNALQESWCSSDVEQIPADARVRYA
jgi:hypothetical protein